jgi:hypothetical protein
LNYDVHTFSHTDTFSLTFDIDDDALDLEPGDPTVAFYEAISNLHGSVSNGYTFSLNAPGDILVVQNNYVGQDYVSFEAFNVSGNPVAGQPLTEIGLGFCCNLSMLNSDAVPNMASLLSLSDQHNFLLRFGWGLDSFGVPATITAASIVPSTPIPAAFPLFASALGGLGFIARRKRRVVSQA